MEWGFEGEGGAEEATDEVAPASSEGEGEDGAPRSRRRRRRGKRDDRPAHRSEHRHEHRAHADRPERAGNGNATEDADHDDVAQVADDQNEASELPAGLGDQPQVARSEDDTGEKRGRRRRRGRRGGRRGRDRDGARESGGRRGCSPRRQRGRAVRLRGTGCPSILQPSHLRPERRETEREKEYETASAGQVREQTWQAPEAERSPAPEPKAGRSRARTDRARGTERRGRAGRSDAPGPQGMVAAQAARLTDGLGIITTRLRPRPRLRGRALVELRLPVQSAAQLAGTTEGLMKARARAAFAAAAVTALLSMQVAPAYAAETCQKIRRLGHRRLGKLRVVHGRGGHEECREGQIR